MMEQRGRRITLLCVDHQEALLGMIEVSQRARVEGAGAGPVAYVDALHVEQGEARETAARKLAEAAAGWAQARGCRALVSDTSLENHWEQKLHLELGFEEVARKVFYRRTLAAPALEPRAPAAGPRPVPVAEVQAEEAGELVMEDDAPGRWPGALRAGIIVLGLLALYFTDIFSGSAFFGVVLPIIDVIFIIYLLMLFVGMKYRRRLDASDRQLELYQAPRDLD